MFRSDWHLATGGGGRGPVFPFFKIVPFPYVYFTFTKKKLLRACQVRFYATLLLSFDATLLHNLQVYPKFHPYLHNTGNVTGSWRSEPVKSTYFTKQASRFFSSHTNLINVVYI